MAHIGGDAVVRAASSFCGRRRRVSRKPLLGTEQPDVFRDFQAFDICQSTVMAKAGVFVKRIAKGKCKLCGTYWL